MVGRDRRTRPSYLPTNCAASRPWLLLLALFIASCTTPDTRHQIVVSAREQKLALLDRGSLMAIYPVSTSKFGLGDRPGSCFTPLGELEVAKKLAIMRRLALSSRIDAAPAKSLQSTRQAGIQL